MQALGHAQNTVNLTGFELSTCGSSPLGVQPEPPESAILRGQMLWSDHHPQRPGRCGGRRCFIQRCQGHVNKYIFVICMFSITQVARDLSVEELATGKENHIVLNKSQAHFRSSASGPLPALPCRENRVELGDKGRGCTMNPREAFPLSTTGTGIY